MKQWHHFADVIASLNGRWCLSLWSTSNRVNPRTDSVRTLRGCIVPLRGNDPVYHDFPLSVFPEFLAWRERLSENIFARSSVISNPTGTTSGLMYNNLMVTCKNRNVILIYLCLPGERRSRGEKLGTLFQAWHNDCRWALKTVEMSCKS